MDSQCFKTVAAFVKLAGITKYSIAFQSRLGRDPWLRPYTDEELSSVKNPTLLIIGQQESLYDPIAALERAKRLIPDIQTELIPHAGHELALSKPEAVDQRILTFLKG